MLNGQSLSDGRPLNALDSFVTHFEIRFSVLIEMFMTSISFRGTFQSFWDLAEVSEHTRYIVLKYN